jgi:nucleotide-binding universal stress UspA family protein
MNNTYSKILLTHDGSNFSGEALPHAISVAKVFNAEIIVLQVIDFELNIIPAVTTSGATIGTRMILKDIAKRERKAAKDMLNKVKQQLDKAGVTKVTIAIEEGDAREAIITVAKDHACNLIVMATHGRTGLKRALLGSVADYVVRNAPCPVLLINANNL